MLSGFCMIFKFGKNLLFTLFPEAPNDHALHKNLSV
jgi:hypothetical protein